MGDGAAVEAEARVAVGDGDFAGGHFCGREGVLVLQVGGEQRRRRLRRGGHGDGKGGDAGSARVDEVFLFLLYFYLFSRGVSD